MTHEEAKIFLIEHFSSHEKAEAYVKDLSPEKKEEVKKIIQEFVVKATWKELKEFQINMEENE